MNDLIDNVKAGLPLNDVLIIDCHCHHGPYRNFNNPRNSALDMIKSMDNLGISKACITPHAASVGPDYIYGNDLAIDSVINYPERFLGYVSLNPNYPSDMGHEIERCFKVENMIGIKLHPSYHGAQIDSKAYDDAYSFANRISCPVLIHVWGKEDVAAIDRMAQKFPQAVLIMGHAGADIGAMENACKVALIHENVYLDTALSSAYQGNIEWLTELAGSERILFGTDIPFYDPRHVFGKVAASDLAEKDKKNILGLNMQRILSGVKKR
jgi:Predicted metal-dependent hydrolase of the TIM-barrel fold